MIIAQLFNVCNHDQHDTSKTLTTASQPDYSIKPCVSVTRFLSNETKSGFFMIPFTAANMKYINLGAPFFEKKNQNNNIHDFIKNSKHSEKDQPTTDSFTKLLEIYFDFFVYQFNS